MGLTKSKPISTDPKIINKPVWHVWTVKTSFLQENSLQTSVKAGRARASNLIWLIIKGPFQVSFSSHLNSVNDSHVLRSARKTSDDSSMLAACVELAKLLELTTMLMKKTSCRLVSPTTY